MKQKLFCIISILCIGKSILVNAQSSSFSCNENIDKAISYLQKENYSKKDSISAIKLLNQCADLENPHALFLKGRLHLNNHITIDDKKGFRLTKKSAKLEYAAACTDLGNLYKYGIGCDIDYKKAKKWYQKAHKLDDSRGTYGIGYLYYKGLGVKQNYNKAIKWFKRSDYAMAKHWLGVSYYFGHGVPVNKEKAMGLLQENYIQNSDVMLDCMKYHLNQNDSKVDASIQKDILDAELKNTDFSLKSLNGTWIGSLIQLDWSENTIEQLFPVALEFDEDSENETTTYKLELQDQLYEGIAENFENTLLFDDFDYNFKRLYFNDDTEQNIYYDVLSASFDLKVYEDQDYLTAILDTYVPTMKEPGNKFALILTKEGNITENGKTLSKEVEDALNNQTEDFIKLYPNPFKKDLYISYILKNSGLVQVEVSDLNGNQKHVLEQSKEQNAGNYTYYFDGSVLGQGINVITVFVNGEKYTKLIAKR